MELDRVLASSCRRKILKVLIKKNQASIMELAQTINSTYNEVNRNLNILEREGLVTQQHIGHKRIIGLNHENQETLILLKVLEILERTYRSPQSPIQDRQKTTPASTIITTNSKK